MKIINSYDFTNINVVASIICSDWVLDAKWIDDDTLSLVCMHNKIQIWNSSLQFELENECEDKCILYSGHIYSESKNVTVFSGTVFSEILIWKLQSVSKYKSPVLKRLKGHKVSVYSKL